MFFLLSGRQFWQWERSYGRRFSPPESFLRVTAPLFLEFRYVFLGSVSVAKVSIIAYDAVETSSQTRSRQHVSGSQRRSSDIWHQFMAIRCTAVLMNICEGSVTVSLWWRRWQGECSMDEVSKRLMFSLSEGPRRIIYALEFIFVRKKKKISLRRVFTRRISLRLRCKIVAF